MLLMGGVVLLSGLGLGGKSLASGNTTVLLASGCILLLSLRLQSKTLILSLTSLLRLLNEV